MSGRPSLTAPGARGATPRTWSGWPRALACACVAAVLLLTLGVLVARAWDARNACTPLLGACGGNGGGSAGTSLRANAHAAAWVGTHETALLARDARRRATRVEPLPPVLVRDIWAASHGRRGRGGGGGGEAHPAAAHVPCFTDTAIPRRVVLTYRAPTRSALLPALQRAVESWETDPAEPDVRVHYYDDAAARAFLVAHYPPCVSDAWDALVPGAYRADLFRACEVFVAGGVYADIKCTREQPYSVLLGGAGSRGVVAVEWWATGLHNGFFAAPPGAPWVGLAICRAVELVRARAYGATHLDLTGPGCMGRAFREWLGLSPSSMSCVFLADARAREALWHADKVHVLTYSVYALHDAAGRAVVSMLNGSYRWHQSLFSFTDSYVSAWALGRVFRTPSRVSAPVTAETAANANALTAPNADALTTQNADASTAANADALTAANADASTAANADASTAANADASTAVL